jgi:hypothetical protein
MLQGDHKTLRLESNARCELGHAAATQVLGAADQLAKQSEMLRRQVEGFLVTIRAA